MEREWSVYALDASKSTMGALKRTGSLSSTSTASSGTATGRWFTGVGHGGSKGREVKNEEVRNALTSAFLQTISRSLPSIDIVI